MRLLPAALRRFRDRKDRTVPETVPGRARGQETADGLDTLSEEQYDEFTAAARAAGAKLAEANRRKRAAAETAQSPSPDPPPNSNGPRTDR